MQIVKVPFNKLEYVFGPSTAIPGQRKRCVRRRSNILHREYWTASSPSMCWVTAGTKEDVVVTNRIRKCIVLRSSKPTENQWPEECRKRPEYTTKLWTATHVQSRSHLAQESKRLRRVQTRVYHVPCCSFLPLIHWIRRLEAEKKASRRKASAAYYARYVLPIPRGQPSRLTRRRQQSAAA